MDVRDHLSLSAKARLPGSSLYYESKDIVFQMFCNIMGLCPVSLLHLSPLLLVLLCITDLQNEGLCL